MRPSGRTLAPPPPAGAADPAAPVRPPHRWSRLLPLLPLLPLAAAVWWVERFNPADNIPDPTGPCTWHMLTGINGPTCGGTRAFYYLIHANLVEAVRFHLPFVLAVPFLAYWWLEWLLGRTIGVRLPSLRPRPWMLIAYGIFFLTFTTVLRNLPGFGWFDIPNLTHRMT